MSPYSLIYFRSHQLILSKISLRKCPAQKTAEQFPLDCIQAWASPSLWGHSAILHQAQHPQTDVILHPTLWKHHPKSLKHSPPVVFGTETEITHRKVNPALSQRSIRMDPAETRAKCHVVQASPICINSVNNTDLSQSAPAGHTARLISYLALQQKGYLHKGRQLRATKS